MAKSIRKPGHDYTSPGRYFITICGRRSPMPWSTISNGVATPTAIGEAMQSCWWEIPEHHPHVEPEDFVVMPDHLHGILWFNAYPMENPLALDTGTLRIGSLSVVMNQFKGGVTKWCNANGLIPFQWQRGYYDRIIQSDKALKLVQRYIAMNPAKWQHRGR